MKPYPNELLTEIIDLLAEHDPTLEQVRNLAADLPRAFKDAMEARADEARAAWHDPESIAARQGAYEATLALAGRI